MSDPPSSPKPEPHFRETITSSEAKVLRGWIRLAAGAPAVMATITLAMAFLMTWPPPWRDLGLAWAVLSAGTILLEFVVVLPALFLASRRIVPRSVEILDRDLSIVSPQGHITHAFSDCTWYLGHWCDDSIGLFTPWGRAVVLVSPNGVAYAVGRTAEARATIERLVQSFGIAKAARRPAVEIMWRSVAKAAAHFFGSYSFGLLIGLLSLAITGDHTWPALLGGAGGLAGFVVGICSVASGGIAPSKRKKDLRLRLQWVPVFAFFGWGFSSWSPWCIVVTCFFAGAGMWLPWQIESLVGDYVSKPQDA